MTRIVDSGIRQHLRLINGAACCHSVLLNPNETKLKAR